MRSRERLIAIDNWLWESCARVPLCVALALVVVPLGWLLRRVRPYVPEVKP